MAIPLSKWRANVCGLVGEFADEAYQRANWFGKGKFFSSPDEMYELLDDFSVEDYLTASEVGLDDGQRAAGRKFLDAVNAFDKPMESMTLEEIIDHPMWRDVRRAAQAFYALLERGKS